MEIGQYSKVCVAIFLILSGYGLSESTRSNPINIKKFYLRHIPKIYTNYWLIWIIFVPIGILFFNRTFNDVYTTQIVPKLLINFLGFQDYFGFYGYNPTWWFISAILALYMIFPFLRTLVVKYKHYFLFICIFIMFINVKPVIIHGYEFNPYSTIKYWIFPFVFGIYVSENELFCKLKYFKKKYSTFNDFHLSIYILFLAIFALQRTYGLLLDDVKIDAFFGFTIILIGKDFLSKSNNLNKFMKVVGEHSFNIFLFHTFISYFYFSKFIYFFRYPPIIFLVLLISCILISVALEKIKSTLKINLLYNKITKLDLQSSIIVD